jgi:hypothetical protein
MIREWALVSVISIEYSVALKQNLKPTTHNFQLRLFRSRRAIIAAPIIATRSTTEATSKGRRYVVINALPMPTAVVGGTSTFVPA